MIWLLLLTGVALIVGAVWLYVRHTLNSTSIKSVSAVSVVYRHELHVLYKNGKSEKWYFERDKNLGPIALWKPFVRWWYCQQNKPYFAVQVPGKHIMLSRENIVRFSLQVSLRVYEG